MDAKIIIMMVMISVPVHGVILFQENFEDTNFASRGWYDHLQGTVTTAEHVAGSSSAFECIYTQGQTGCAQGVPGRHLFTDTDIIYLSFWVKYSTNFIGSGRPYHPHEFHFITNKDSIYVGPAGTHLTTYMEQVGGKPHMAIQDLSNVNSGCIVRNNDPIDACDQYNYGEARSVASCNGIMGDLDTRDCFQSGSGWYSSRAWHADDVYFKDVQGPYYKNDWHFIEAMWEMNSIQNGIGQVDARLRYWYDGELLISSDNIILRTGANADMHFNQFLTGFYIGDGSPVTQTMWVDNLTVSTHRLGYSSSTTVCGDGTCDPGETCSQDNCCNGVIYSANQVCCLDIAETGDCCEDSDCTAPAACINHVCTAPLLTCQSEGYKCCDSCQTNPHPEYDSDCPGQVCCGNCNIDCVHEADQEPCDGCIDTTELSAYINLWRSGSVEIDELMEAIVLWKQGCPAA